MENRKNAVVGNLTLKATILLLSCAILVGVSTPSYAAKRYRKPRKEKKGFPGGCRSAGHSFRHFALMLKPYAAGKSQSLYFIHDISYKSVKLYQMNDGSRPYIMHLNNKINANQWGVFATDAQLVKFICTIPSKNSTYGKVVNCKNVVEVCEYVNVKFASNNHGNYWAVKSNTKYGARNQVIRQGVLLRW